MATKEQVRQEYLPQDVIHQSLVAFGQGAGCVRVSSRACREFVGLMSRVEEAGSLHETWGEIGVQMLERMRAVGRIAASLLLEKGRVTIEKEEVAIAFRRVQLGSKTGDCDKERTANASGGG